MQKYCRLYRVCNLAPFIWNLNKSVLGKSEPMSTFVSLGFSGPKRNKKIQNYFKKKEIPLNTSQYLWTTTKSILLEPLIINKSAGEMTWLHPSNYRPSLWSQCGREGSSCVGWTKEQYICHRICATQEKGNSMSDCALSDSGIQIVKQNAAVAIIIFIIYMYLSLYIYTDNT